MNLLDKNGNCVKIYRMNKKSIFFFKKNFDTDWSEVTALKISDWLEMTLFPEKFIFHF